MNTEASGEVSAGTDTAVQNEVHEEKVSLEELKRAAYDPGARGMYMVMKRVSLIENTVMELRNDPARCSHIRELLESMRNLVRAMQASRAAFIDIVGWDRVFACEYGNVDEQSAVDYILGEVCNTWAGDAVVALQILVNRLHTPAGNPAGSAHTRQCPECGSEQQIPF